MDDAHALAYMSLAGAKCPEQLLLQFQDNVPKLLPMYPLSSSYTDVRNILLFAAHADELANSPFPAYTPLLSSVVVQQVGTGCEGRCTGSM